MPFDENLVLHDGTTITADISPTSITRTSGSAALDLRQTGKKGLVAHLLAGTGLAEADDTLQVTLEESDALGSGWVEIARFPELTMAASSPGMYSVRFAVKRRYLRAKIDVTDADSGSDFTVANVYIMLSTSDL